MDTLDVKTQPSCRFLLFCPADLTRNTHRQEIYFSVATAVKCFAAEFLGAIRILVEDLFQL
jgi:ferredoxin-like protein FixX